MGPVTRTDKRKKSQTDECYQMHYLPAMLSMKRKEKLFVL